MSFDYHSVKFYSFKMVKAIKLYKSCKNSHICTLWVPSRHCYYYYYYYIQLFCVEIQNAMTIIISLLLINI